MGSISASIPSNYVLRVSKTSVAAGTFAGHELFVAKKVSPTLGDNYIDVINHRSLRATLASYSVVDISSLLGRNAGLSDKLSSRLIKVVNDQLLRSVINELIQKSFRSKI